MTLTQIILLLVAIAIFYIFFKQLFSGNYTQSELATQSQEKIAPSHNNLNKSKNDRVKELFEIAQNALEQNDNLEAKKALESLLILEPNNLDAKRMLAVSYLNMNNYPKAKELLEEILNQNPNDDLAHNMLANTLHKLGEDEQALFHHKKAVELDPEYAKYYYNWANTLYDLGKVQEAKELYQKALSLDPNFKEAQKAISEIENGK